VVDGVAAGRPRGAAVVARTERQPQRQLPVRRAVHGLERLGPLAAREQREHGGRRSETARAARPEERRMALHQNRTSTPNRIWRASPKNSDGSKRSSAAAKRARWYSFAVMSPLPSKSIRAL